jgi:hypothetical protein
VELAAPGGHVEIDHRRDVRAPLAIGAERLADCIHRHLRRDDRSQRRFFNYCDHSSASTGIHDTGVQEIRRLGAIIFLRMHPWLLASTS